jgi:pancreatic lipase-related protein 1
VHWEKYAEGPNYYQAAHNTIAVGKALASVIKNIGLDATTDIYCVGHSLGSHVCGFCGKQKQLRRITGSTLIEFKV